MKVLTSKLIGLRYLQSHVLYKYSPCRSKSDIKVAVIGSGPAGFYLTQYLLKNPAVKVDIYEKSPVPFGLIRFGVAPDHPEVKVMFESLSNVTNSFTTTASNDRVSFYGNVSIKEDITLKDIRSAYNAVVLCYGSSRDRLLNIPGEDLANVIPARRFVGWYNGVPEDKSLPVSLDMEDVAIIGHGNVALDCARILLTPVDSILDRTDITDHALKVLQKSSVKNVHLIGRRGPLQVAFTIKELREMTKIKDSQTIVNPNDVEHITSEVLASMKRPRKRLTELLLKIARESEIVQECTRKCFIHFLKSPLEIVQKGVGPKSIDVKLGVNEFISDHLSQAASIKLTDKKESLQCGLVLRSVGYTTVSIDDSIPMDKRKGTISNVAGRVLDAGPGLYCSGWAATGATGVIINTMNVSFEVGKNILDDIENGSLASDVKPGSSKIIELLEAKNVKYVSFDDWKNIDKFEQSLGERLGKPREKIVDVQELVAAAKVDCSVTK